MEDPGERADLEPLIKERRRRTRRRRLLYVACTLAVAVGVAIAAGVYYLVQDHGSSRGAAGGSGATHSSVQGELILSGTLRGRFFIYGVRADGTHLRLVTKTHSATPALSPDGSTLAFARQREPGGHRPDLYLFHLPSGQMRRIFGTAGGGEPQWTPDGRRIVYHVCPQRIGACALWSIRPDGSDRRLLSKGLTLRGPTAISPDSRWVAFTSLAHWTPFPRYERGRLYAEQIDGSHRRLLARQILYPSSWSKHGLLVFKGPRVLETVSLTGRERGYLHSRTSLGPTLSSPDGNWLAYTRDVYSGAEYAGVRLWVGRATDSGLQTVYKSRVEGDIFLFGWSPDSRHLVYTRLEKGERTLVVIINPTDPRDHSAIRIFHPVRFVGWS